MSPIKGITDSMPRLGKLRIGERKKNIQGKEYPASLDYFILKSDNEKLVQKFTELYGEKPSRIKIQFYSDDAEVVFPQWLKRYSKDGLLCRGDGERAWRRQDDGSVVEQECLYRDCEDYKAKKCKPVGSLRFLIPEISTDGFFQLDTSSYNSIKNINGGLHLLKMVNDNKLTGKDVMLDVSTEQAKGRKFSVLHIEVNYEIDDDVIADWKKQIWSTASEICQDEVERMDYLNDLSMEMFQRDLKSLNVEQLKKLSDELERRL